jgi:hypothetical protein
MTGKGIIGILKSKKIYINFFIALILISRILVFTPELKEQVKHKRKLPPPNITREITFEERLKNVRDEKEKPSVKIKKKTEQQNVASSINISFFHSDESSKTFTPYFGQYIDPPKLVC